MVALALDIEGGKASYVSLVVLCSKGGHLEGGVLLYEFAPGLGLGLGLKYTWLM